MAAGRAMRILCAEGLFLAGQLAGAGGQLRAIQAFGGGLLNPLLLDAGGGFFHGFFPWYFIGRTFGVGPMAGVRTAPAANQKQNTAPAGSSTNPKPNANTANGSTVQQGTAGSTQSSKLGSTGTTGKSGIGSGMSRSSGSAIS